MADLLAAADKLGWRLTDEADLQSIGGRLDHNSLLKAFGDLDIRDFGAPILDKLTKSQKIEGPLVLQIKNIRNVSAPKINESSGAHPKLLKITLTDGHATVNALDLSRNPVISLDTPPGTKVLIKGIVPVEQRFWILSDRSVDCLGGKVEHLVEKWEISKISDVHFSRIRKTGADGPPPWIPFGQRLKTAVQTVDGNFKALGVQSSNPSDADGPDEFALARQQTISELKSQSGQVAAKKFESVKVPLTNGTAALSEAQPRERKTKATGKQESSKYCRDVRMAFDNDYDDPNEAQKPAAPTTLMDFLDSKVLKDQPKANVKPSYEPSQEQPRYDQRGYDNRQNSRDNNSRDSSSTYRGRGRGQSGADSGRGRGRGGRGQNSDRPQRAYDHGREDMDRRNQPIQRPFQTYEADFPQVSKPPPSTQPSRQSNDARLAGADMVKHFGAMKISNEIAAQPTRKEYPRSQWQRGDVCLAQYFGDGRFYDATIVAVDDRTQMCDVLFENFSNVEQVAIRNLLPHPRYTMTLLENEHFLAELGKLFQKAKTSSSISITMKRYDGRTKPKPRDVEELPVPHEYKCLFRASVGSKKISTVVNPKEVNKFQLAYASLLKLHMDSLKKREKKADKDKEKKTVRLELKYNFRMNQRGPFPNFFTSPQMNAPNIRPFQANVFPPTPFQPRQQLLMGPIIMRQTAPQAFIQQFQPSMPSFQRSMVERNFIRPLMNGAVPPVRFPNDPGLQQRQVVNLNQQGNWNFGQVRQPQFVAQNCHQPNSVLPVRIPQQFQQESRPLVAMNPRPNPNEINRDVTPWSVRMSVSPLVQEDSVATEFLPTRIAPEMMSNQRKLMPLMEIVTCPPTTTSDNSLLRPSIHPTAAASTSSAYGQKRPLIDDPTANDFLATKMMRFSPDRPPLPVPVPHRPLIRTSINDLLIPPGREKRPEKLLLIFRGLPGSGKSHTAKLIKEKEIEYGGVAPRILCFDDYFMVEEEESVVKYGGKPTETISSYEYDPAMEPSYRKQFIKSFKKTVDGGFFNFIILDAVHQKLNYFDEMWCYARQNGYEVYVVECHADVHTCAERNIHSRSAKDIEDMWKSWEETPPHFTQVDCGPLFHQCEEEIQEVDMDLQTSSQPDAPPEPMTSDDRGSPPVIHPPRVSQSKWELLDATEVKLDQLDGLKSSRKHGHGDDSFDEDVDTSQLQPGKKRVRWADVEEHKDMERQKAMGFVVGVTDWRKITGHFDPGEALTRTKYI